MTDLEIIEATEETEGGMSDGWLYIALLEAFGVVEARVRV